jgi:UDP-N-acetyl-D-mannosaminuronate dehydrogenase
MLKTYHLQIAVLPLVQAMVTMPELRKLDALHDEEIISWLMKACRRLGIRKKDDELNRIGCLVLEISHALFMVIVKQNKQQGSKTLTDLKGILKEYMRQQMV